MPSLWGLDGLSPSALTLEVILIILLWKVLNIFTSVNVAALLDFCLNFLVITFWGNSVPVVLQELKYGVQMIIINVITLSM